MAWTTSRRASIWRNKEHANFKGYNAKRVKKTYQESDYRRVAELATETKCSDSTSDRHIRDTSDLCPLSLTGCRRCSLWQDGHDGLAGSKEEPAGYIRGDTRGRVDRSEQYQPNPVAVRLARVKQRYCRLGQVRMSSPEFVEEWTASSSHCRKVDIAANSLVLCAGRSVQLQGISNIKLSCLLSLFCTAGCC